MNKLFEKVVEQNNKFQETIKQIEVSEEAGAGMVKVRMNGQYQVLALFIEDEIYQEGKLVVTDLVMAATNKAIEKVRQAIRDKMIEFTSGFGLPTNFPFFS